MVGLSIGNTMKVLKYSVNPKTWTLAITCDWCQSQIEISANDLSHEGERGDYRDPGWDRYTVDCGACGQEIEIPEKKLPNIIQSYAERKKK